MQHLTQVQATGSYAGSLHRESRVSEAQRQSVARVGLQEVRWNFSAAETDFRHWGISLSRRAKCFKVWFLLRLFGVKTLRSYIRQFVRLAKRFRDHISNDHRLEIVGEQVLALVCFRVKVSRAGSLRLTYSTLYAGYVTDGGQPSHGAALRAHQPVPEDVGDARGSEQDRRHSSVGQCAFFDDVGHRRILDDNEGPNRRIFQSR